MRMVRIFILIFSFILMCHQAFPSNVVLRKDERGSWRLYVDGKPYFIKGITYDPVKIGEKLTSSNTWMNYDFNHNGINDCAYESWVDKNRNGIQDKDEKTVGDFYLLKEMGINTIRIYHYANVRKKLLRDLYKRFGIRVIMGNFMGAYCWGSGALWKNGTDYTNEQEKDNMLADVRKMVLEYKDEPYVLAWMLGNENDMKGSYGNSTFNNTNARDFPEEFAKFVNKIAGVIHKLDPNHPLGVCNGSYLLLPYYKKYAPELDFVGFNSYKGPFGFGSLFRTVKFYIDKPVLITEYGVDSFDQNKGKEDEDYQVFYHRNAWRDIVANSKKEPKNSIGGIIHTWLDAWWYCGKPDEHDIEKGAWQGPTKDSWFNDEWLGIASQGNGENSPFVRQLRKVYYFYRKELK